MSHPQVCSWCSVITETGIKNRTGQRAECILQRMVGTLQVGAQSGQVCSSWAFWDPSPESGLNLDVSAGNVLFFPCQMDFPHQAAFEASSQVVVNLGMSGKHSKDTWVMGVLEIPHSQSTAVPPVTYKLLVASWHQRKGTFLEHFFGAGSTDAVCHLGPGRCPFCPGQRAFNGAAALSEASWLLPAD